MKWTQLANLPALMYGAYVAVQDKKVYVAGDSPVDDAEHQVYMSMMSTLTTGVSYLPLVTITVFLTSSVASWLLLVDVCLLLRREHSHYC